MDQRVPFEQLQQELERVLQQVNFTPDRARRCARLFAETTRDGVYSHGLNRFPRFIEYIQKGYVDVRAEPKRMAQKGGLEQWDGQQGPGNLNAQTAMARAIELAREYGIGGVGLKNTNHWMRGGSYGWQAADANCLGICFTNTLPNMPPWGGTEPRLGNNPLVLAVPGPAGQHVVVDMALSQFSYGKMQLYAETGQPLPVAGGYDAAGQLTQDAAAIRAAGRPVPVGFWKGSGLSLLLDLLAGLLTGGRTVADIAQLGNEYGVSQVFICCDLSLVDTAFAENLVRHVIAYTKSSQPVEGTDEIRYPGENTWRTRQENLRLGVPVDEKIWQEVRAM